MFNYIRNYQTVFHFAVPPAKNKTSCCLASLPATYCPLLLGVFFFVLLLFVFCYCFLAILRSMYLYTLNVGICNSLMTDNVCCGLNACVSPKLWWKKIIHSLGIQNSYGRENVLKIVRLNIHCLWKYPLFICHQAKRISVVLDVLEVCGEDIYFV